MNETIIQVCLHFGLSLSELQTRSRCQKYVIPRMIVAKLIYGDNKKEEPIARD
jgi:hypothetical protein